MLSSLINRSNLTGVCDILKQYCEHSENTGFLDGLNINFSNAESVLYYAHHNIEFKPSEELRDISEILNKGYASLLEVSVFMNRFMKAFYPDGYGVILAITPDSSKCPQVVNLFPYGLVEGYCQWLNIDNGIPVQLASKDELFEKIKEAYKSVSMEIIFSEPKYKIFCYLENVNEAVKDGIFDL